MKRANLTQGTSGNERISLRIKISIMSIIAALIFGSSACTAQQTVVNVQATNNDISNNLDLQAVASLFGETQNLEEFERRLNDYDNGISNLDLNNDGQIDYLRVVESMEDNTHVIVIQAVLDRNVFQDVATINVERRENRRTVVYLVGDPYLYGINYIIEPRYMYTPPIFSIFWGYNYRCWYSPYYYGYYPTYYHYRRPLEINLYYSNVRRHVNRDHRYYYSPDYRRNDRSESIRRSISRSDYATRYPDRTFNSRNTNMTNRRDFDNVRSNNGLYDRNRNSNNENRYGTRSSSNYSQGTRNSDNNNNRRSSVSNNETRNSVQDDIYTNRRTRNSSTNNESSVNNGRNTNNANSEYSRSGNYGRSTQSTTPNSQSGRSATQDNGRNDRYQRRESSNQESRPATTQAPASRESNSRQTTTSQQQQQQQQPSSSSQSSTSNQSSSRQSDSRSSSGTQSSGRR